MIAIRFSFIPTMMTTGYSLKHAAVLTAVNFFNVIPTLTAIKIGSLETYNPAGICIHKQHGQCPDHNGCRLGCCGHRNPLELPMRQFRDSKTGEIDNRFKWIRAANEFYHQDMRGTFYMEKMGTDQNEFDDDIQASIITSVIDNESGPRSVNLLPQVTYGSGTITDYIDKDLSSTYSIYVNAASKYSICGGVQIGSKHALEESLCSMSNLQSGLTKIYTSDENMNKRLKAIHRGSRYSPYFDHKSHDYIYDTAAVILNTNVTFNRKGSNSGYAKRDKAIKTNIISLAMPNYIERDDSRNIVKGASDSYNDTKNLPKPELTWDGKVPDGPYKSVIFLKFRAMLKAAESVPNATRLVIPDVGCEKYNNDERAVGDILGEVLKNYTPVNIKEVVLTGGYQFKKNVFNHFPNHNIRQTTAFTPLSPFDLGYLRRERSQDSKTGYDSTTMATGELPYRPTTMATEGSPEGPTTMATVGSPKSSRDSKRRKKDVCPCCDCWLSNWFFGSCWGISYS